ncbi:DUF192 domain-containing protein [Halobacteriales archaeon QH_2_65_14]|nr:MAG: DUF192 domain-containing protein [Halobacteriales archaeon QH_2_65_14]
MRQRTAGIVVLGLVTFLVLVLANPPSGLLDPGEYETTTVSVHADETQLATVEVRIADTYEKRRIGLSRTDSLANGSGMLFVHPETGTYGYHMRNMSFPLDIVFVADNGTITRVHHASVPDGVVHEPYRGRGKYVLEVPRGWANATGIGPGDRVRIPENVTASNGYWRPWS